MAQHRSGTGFGLVIGLAVGGAVASAVLISALGLAPHQPTAPRAQASALPAMPVRPTAGASPEVPSTSDAPSPVPSSGPPSIAAAAPRKPPGPPVHDTPAAKPVGLTARYAVVRQSRGGSVVAVSVNNPGGHATAWTVQITVAPHVTIAGVWNAAVQRSGDTYTFRANSGTALGASQTVQFAYIAAGPRGAGTPARCTVNGRTCT